MTDKWQWIKDFISNLALRGNADLNVITWLMVFVGLAIISGGYILIGASYEIFLMYFSIADKG